ncbi:MAG: hypothetical protein IJO54_03880 [Oscillospiraceae bacterium]|nr:hypothetical protein [Oscillospiraceae bacterium]
MKKKLELLSTIAMLVAAIVCIAVNFSEASSGATVTATNITATVFFLLFWALMTRFEAAAKVSAFIALYTTISGIVAICAFMGGWESLFTNVFTAPAIMLFYGIKFINNINVLCGVMSIVSFVILIYSLITLANRKPAPKQAVKAEKAAETEEKSESIDISETELVSAAAEYVEMINTFENKELELPPEESAEQTACPQESAENREEALQQ